VEEKVMQRMRRGALTCTENTTIREVSQIMVVNRTRYCVVVNDRHEVTGIISARSILKAFGADLDKTRARDILLPYTVTITPNSSLANAIELMVSKKIEHLVVVSDRPGSKAAFGILSAADLVRHMARR
jgi:osmoprotectant transport system ATP-binding protein